MSTKKSNRRTKKITVVLDEDTYWKLKIYMGALKIGGWSKLFREYIIQYLENLIAQHKGNIIADTVSTATSNKSIDGITQSNNIRTSQDASIDVTPEKSTDSIIEQYVNTDQSANANAVSNINIPDSETFIDLIESMNRNRDFLSREMLISMFKSRNINALSEEQYEYLIEEIPKLKEYFVKEGEYYKIKGLDNK